MRRMHTSCVLQAIQEAPETRAFLKLHLRDRSRSTPLEGIHVDPPLSMAHHLWQ